MKKTEREQKSINRFGCQINVGHGVKLVCVDVRRYMPVGSNLISFPQKQLAF